MESLFCKVCDIRCKYPSHYKAHIKSKSHKQKEDPSLKPGLTCDVCNVRFRSYKEMERHSTTQKHMKNLAKTDLKTPTQI